MTLTELAIELRKIFKFKYLVAEQMDLDFNNDVTIWAYFNKPTFNNKRFFWASTFVPEMRDDSSLAIRSIHLNNTLDLSEYKDESGKVDYSRCIVDLSEYKEGMK